MPIIRLLPFVVVVSTLPCVMGADCWKAPELASSDDVRLTGIWAAAQAQSAERLASPPLNEPSFILDDVSLKQHRKFAEYSGDISGRWIGAAAFLRPLYPKPFAALPAIVAEIPAYQKSDGHFGADQKLPTIERERDMPILWGNGRLLIGLVEVYERTGDEQALKTAKRIGDYFVATDPVYNRAENLHGVGGSYADGFATCYFSCVEGLVALGRVTKDARYLDEAKRIADLALTVDNFDGLHSHGRLCAVRGFADLYDVTGDRHWLAGAERDWQIFMQHYRLPTGGVKEVLDATWSRDEGCSECDWLRLNLSLWRLTGNGRYLDEAERCLKGHFLYQQYPNGSAGSRELHQIDGQVVAFKGFGEEAWWCCGEHWARATVDVARFAVTGRPEGLDVNLAIDCKGAISGPGGTWTVAMRETEDGLRISLQNPAAKNAVVRVHRPAWASEGTRVETPVGLSMVEASDAWRLSGDWSGVREIAVHWPTTLRSESVTANTSVLLRGHDLLAAHDVPANGWLMKSLPSVRPVVLWAAAMPAKDGRVVAPASLKPDADPNRPEQWKLLELQPLRALTARPHEAAWFCFHVRAATPEEIARLAAKLDASKTP